MDSAIAPHLRCPRSRTMRVDEDYVPPYPSWSARATASVEQVVMGYFGVQYHAPGDRGRAWAALRQIVSHFDADDGPGHHDLAQGGDADGCDTLVAIAYWRDPARFARWRDGEVVRAWWASEQRLHDGLGYFRELMSPRVERFETAFSTPDRLEGIGVVMGGISGEIQEHGYWGSMRDRIPLAQTDAMKPSGAPCVIAGAPGPGRRVRVAGHENVALIRSGQEWTDTAGQERALYLNDMEPVLREGMDFLRDAGTAIGCYGNRYLRHVDGAGQPLEKSFGLSVWRSLADMERWSESHPTHVAIFGTFMRMVQALGGQLQLRLYHEVSVLRADEQDYEYVNCHPRTGLLNALGR